MSLNSFLAVLDIEFFTSRFERVATVGEREGQGAQIEEVAAKDIALL